MSITFTPVTGVFFCQTSNFPALGVLQLVPCTYSSWFEATFCIFPGSVHQLGPGLCTFMHREFKKFCFRQNPFFLPFALLFGLLSVCAVHNFLFYKSGAAVRMEVQTSQQNKQNTNCSPRVKQEENKNICSELLSSCNTKKTKTFSQKRNNLNSEICWPWFDCDVVTFFFLSRVVYWLDWLTDWRQFFVKVSVCYCKSIHSKMYLMFADVYCCDR